MSRDILDLIDNAIAGATSSDAMRWTPDAEKVTEPSRTFVDLMREYENALDARVLGPQISPTLAGSATAQATRDAERARAVTGAARTFAPITMGAIQVQARQEPGTQHTWIAPLGTPAPVGPIEDNPAWINIDSLVQPVSELITTAVTSLAESLSSFLRHAGTAIGPAVETMREAGVIPERPPADPMARALWLRQHRSTGPAIRSRAPRRIDARRAR